MSKKILIEIDEEKFNRVLIQLNSSREQLLDVDENESWAVYKKIRLRNDIMNGVTYGYNIEGEKIYKSNPAIERTEKLMTNLLILIKS